MADQGQVRGLFIEVTPNISDSPLRSFSGKKEGEDRAFIKIKKLGKFVDFVKG